MTATQTGVARTSRQEALNLIEAKRNEQLNDELAEGGSKTQIAFIPTQLTEPDDDAAAEARENSDSLADAAVVNTPARDEPAKADIYDFLDVEKVSKTKVRIKVDGMEQDVVVGDLLRDAQKHKAADRRLEEAALTKRNAETEASEIIRKATEQATTMLAAKTGTTESSNTSPSSDAMSKAMSLLYEGEQDQAAKALSEVIAAEVERRVGTKNAETTVNIAAITQQVSMELTWNDELRKFSAENPDIASDPILLGTWQANLNELAEESSTPAEAVGKATASTRSWIKKVSGGTGSGSDDGTVLQDRQARKDAAGRFHVNTSTSARAPRQTQADAGAIKPTDVIAEMKKQRGQ